MPAKKKDTVELELDAQIPCVDAFFRVREAEREFTYEQRRVARSCIDFAAAVLLSADQVRPERRVRDLVTAALLRRAIVSAESVRVLVSAGLIEAAISSSRTLLEIEVSIDLILGDPSDRYAKRLALACARDYREHGQGIFSDPKAREASDDRLDSLRMVTADYKRLTQSETFDEVRAELRAERNWHGYKNTEEFFKSRNRGAEYVVSYDAFSWFVHGVNIEFDLSTSGPHGPSLRALVERDPKVTLNPLGLALLRLLQICDAFIEDRGGAKMLGLDPPCRLTRADGHVEILTPLQALHSQLLAHFDVRPDAPLRPARAP
jgi:hypothetical protein